LVQQISRAAVQQSLISDAGCAYLADQIPAFAFRSGDFSSYIAVLTSGIGSSLSTSVIYNPFLFGNISACGSVFPVSIRNVLSLSDTQVAAIQDLIAASNSLNTRKQTRIADVQAEIRDETAKSTPDSVALGVRYVELNEISQELQQADQQTRVAARALLNPAQASTLQGLRNAAALNLYLAAAESCHFLSPPPGISGPNYTEGLCSNYF